MERHLLSKSTFIRGNQCIKSLYLYKNYYKLRDPLTPQQQAVFKRGTNVGVLAQSLFPGGIDCSPPNPFQYQKSAEKTSLLLGRGTECLYEAVFQYNRVLCAMDILYDDGDGWIAVEVKSSTGISETYLLDAALQYYVITNTGLPLKDLLLMYIDNTYVRGENLDLQGLFTASSLLSNAEELTPFIEEKIGELKHVLKQKKVPEVEIGPHCFSPYLCDFFGHCWKDVPEYSVFDIQRLSMDKKFDLYSKGILNLEDVPEEYPLTEKQRTQVSCHTLQEEICDSSRIKDFLSQLCYPLFYIDFESFQPAVPLFKNTRPYQQIPFLYSLHIAESPDSPLIHKEYIAPPPSDPRLPFLQKLLEDTEGTGSIIVYNKTFEAGRLEELKDNFPEFAESIDQRINRIVDLMVPFQQQDLYTPEMMGSYSIKKVLPALAPDMDYSDLSIQDGSTASMIYESLFTEESRERVASEMNKLRKYCERDTFAMVRIYRELVRRADGRSLQQGPSQD